MKDYLKTSVCIVGSGFCGYAAYKKLKEEITDLLIIEGGNLKTPKNSEEQKNYKILKNEYLSNNLRNDIQNGLDPSFNDRKYTLGGSSECWSGFIKPFEESTFKNKFANIPDQNWEGIKISDFDEEVCNLLNSPIIDFCPENVASKLKTKLPKLSNGLKYNTYAWAPEPLRLKNFWKINLMSNHNYDSKNHKLIVGYRLVDFNVVDNKLKILYFKNQSNDDLVVEADYFILSMGGIENAKFVKILFNKANISSFNDEKLGNFQEHPHLRNIAHFNKGKNPLPKIITERVSVSQKIDNSFKDGKVNISISAWDGPGTPKATFFIKTNHKNFLRGFRDRLIQIKGTQDPYQADYRITMVCEQTPNKKSTLSFNSQRSYLNWNINESDFQYYSKYLKRFTSFLMVNKFVKDYSLSEESIKNQATISLVGGGAHHMGTVPYSSYNSLIDRKFRLNEIKNTYIVGTSSFPISGFENPTHAAMATSLVAASDIINKNLKK